MTSCPAISWLEQPALMSFRTSTSRAVSGSASSRMEGWVIAGDLADPGQQHSRITAPDLVSLGLAKQSRHCFALIQEGSHVPLRLGQGKRFFQGSQSLLALLLSLKGQRLEDQGC